MTGNFKILAKALSSIQKVKIHDTFWCGQLLLLVFLFQEITNGVKFVSKIILQVFYLYFLNMLSILHEAYKVNL